MLVKTAISTCPSAFFENAVSLPDEISSSTFAQLGKANIITDRLSNRKYAEYTSIKEVM